MPRRQRPGRSAQGVAQVVLDRPAQEEAAEARRRREIVTEVRPAVLVGDRPADWDRKPRVRRNPRCACGAVLDWWLDTEGCSIRLGLTYVCPPCAGWIPAPDSGRSGLLG